MSKLIDDQLEELFTTYSNHFENEYDGLIFKKTVEAMFKSLIAQTEQQTTIALANRIINVENISNSPQSEQLLDLRVHILESAISYGWEIPEPYKSSLANLRKERNDG